jgi:hypothetical protein
LKKKLYEFSRLDPDPDLSEREKAERYFYGLLNPSVVDDGTSTRRTFIHYMATSTFLKSSYLNAHRPPYDDDGLARGQLDDPGLLAACATNYLLRNLWHNYIHTRLQRINETNYRDFAGTARRESDLEADTLSIVLLAKSYGLPVETKGSAVPNNDIIVMLRRNRCNTMFADRAKMREETLSALEAFEEKEWRYCRFLATYVSGWLLAEGRAAARLGIYIKGDVVRRRNGSYVRKRPTVVAEVNGVRISTGRTGRAEEFGGRSQDKDFDARRHAHAQTIAQAVSQGYGALLEKDTALCAYARRALKERLRLAGVEG